MSEANRKARAAERGRRMILRKTDLEGQARELSPLRGPEAVSLVQVLTRESWRLSGRPEPHYTRSQIPIRFVPWPPSRSKDLADVAALEAGGEQD